MDEVIHFHRTSVHVESCIGTITSSIRAVDTNMTNMANETRQAGPKLPVEERQALEAFAINTVAQLLQKLEKQHAELGALIAKFK